MITALAIGLLTLSALYAIGLALSYRERCENLARQIRHQGGTPYFEDDDMRPAVELTRNDDGTWTARIFDVCLVGTRDECVEWLKANGEYL